jgi:hydroxymethylbilane synthase
MTKIIKVGTRDSLLAKIQTKIAIDYLKNAYKDWAFEIKYIKTSGDRITDKPLYDIGGKALFTKEIDMGIISGEIDIAIHSAKDVEAGYNKDLLTFPCVFPEEDSRDVFIAKNYLQKKSSFQSLQHGAIIGTSSIRRQNQMYTERNDLKFKAIRGNVNTRLNKLLSGELEVDGIILAAAGLKRTGLFSENMEILDNIMPAICQGTIVVQCGAKNFDLINSLSKISHLETMIKFIVQREFVETINGSCTTSIASNVKILNKQIHADFLIYKNEKEFLKKSYIGEISDARKIGKKAGIELLKFYNS